MWLSQTKLNEQQRLLNSVDDIVHDSVYKLAFQRFEQARSLSSERLYLNLVTALGSSPTYSRLPLDEATKRRGGGGREGQGHRGAAGSGPGGRGAKRAIQKPLGARAAGLGWCWIGGGVARAGRGRRGECGFWLYV